MYYYISTNKYKIEILNTLQRKNKEKKRAEKMLKNRHKLQWLKMYHHINNYTYY